jgi:nicotinamide mononucleotide transporter
VLLEYIAAAFGIVSVYLSVRQHIVSWPTAIVNVALYAWIFGNQGFYSDTGLQVVYLVLSIYGWYEWLYGGAGKTALAVAKASRADWILLFDASVLCWFVLSNVTARLPGSRIPLWDAALTTVSLAAQWMMTRKVLENWIVWVIVDVAYVGTFYTRHLYPTCALYAVFLVLAVMGHIEWKRDLDKAATNIDEDRPGGAAAVPS